jgi:hypothetical protein
MIVGFCFSSRTPNISNVFGGYRFPLIDHFPQPHKSLKIHDSNFFLF